jgi:hypothetical protein
MEHRDERIIIETDRHRISGLVRLPVDGYRSRLTDYLNASEREFLALTDVEVTTLNGSARVEQRDFVALSLRHIVLAMPAAEAGVAPESGVASDRESGPASDREPGVAPTRESSALS